MSIRLSLLAVSALLLGACDGNPLQTAAQKTACCCNHCPTRAVPAAKPTPKGPKADRSRAVATSGGARLYRVRRDEVVTRGGYARYETSETGLAGGGYGGRYGARGGVSVSVSGSETSSSRYSASESSSSYGSSSGGYGYGASGGAYAGGGYGAGGAVVSSGPPHSPGYRAAQTGRDGYLTWPGKVDN